MLFALDGKGQHNVRTIYSILEYLGDVGGLYGALEIIASYLTQLFGA